MAAHKALWTLHLADEEGGDDAGQHQHREQVDQKGKPSLLAEPRQRRVRIDRPDHRDDDGGEQDEEAPEDRGMHQTGHESVEQLALPDDYDRLLPGALRYVVEPGSGLAASDEADQAKRTTAEQCAGDHKGGRQRKGWDQVHLCLRISAEIAGTISFRSPATV